jgi:hypothetical protein
MFVNMVKSVIVSHLFLFLNSTKKRKRFNVKKINKINLEFVFQKLKHMV